MDRLAYAVTRTWVLLTYIGVPAVVGVFGSLYAGDLIVAVSIALAATGLAVLLVRRELVSESASRAIAFAGGWTYTLLGPSVREYRIGAPPFTTVGGPQTSRRSTRIMFVGGRNALVERMYVPRDPFYWSGEEYVQLLHLDEAFPTVRLTRKTIQARDLTQPVSMSTELADFNAQWSVVTLDSAFAHAWLIPQVQEHLMALGGWVPKVTLSGAGLYAHGQREDAAYLGVIAARLGHIAAVMPRGVAQKYGSELDAAAAIPLTDVERTVAAMDGPRKAPPRARAGRGPYLAVAAAVVAGPLPILGAILAIAALGAPATGRPWVRMLAWVVLAVSLSTIVLLAVGLLLIG